MLWLFCCESELFQAGCSHLLLMKEEFTSAAITITQPSSPLTGRWAFFCWNISSSRVPESEAGIRLSFPGHL